MLLSVIIYDKIAKNSAQIFIIYRRVNFLNISELLKKIKSKHYSEYSEHLSRIYCFNFFQKNFFNIQEPDFDLAALNLAFYLASWGMDRSSTFVSKCNYKIYVDLLKNLHKKNYQFDLYNIDFITVCSCFDDIKNYLEELRSKISEDKSSKITSTLVTKIMLGIYGITPAFDRLFISGLKQYNDKNNKKTFTPTKFSNLNKFCSAYEEIIAFYNDNKILIDNYSDKDNPPMRIIDELFWHLEKEPTR